MSILKWDETGKKFYETGVKKAVLYLQDESGAYPEGVAWSGISSISESPSGAEANPIYADDTKYLNLMSKEEFGCTIEAYTYPDEFEECDGTAKLDGLAGVMIGQQPRKAFGLCYRTAVGNDVSGDSYGYKLHIVYGCKASPSEKSYSTINDSPEAISFSWTVDTVPVEVTGAEPTSTITIDSRDFATETLKKALAALEDVLYGTDDTEARLPLPDEIATILKATH